MGHHGTPAAGAICRLFKQELHEVVGHEGQLEVHGFQGDMKIVQQELHEVVGQ